MVGRVPYISQKAYLIHWHAFNLQHSATMFLYIAVQCIVAMVVMQYAIYRALDCFDLPTHWATVVFQPEQKCASGTKQVKLYRLEIT